MDVARENSVRFSPALWIALAAGTLQAALLAIYVAAYGGDLSSLVCAGQEKIGRFPFERIRVGFANGGFDGAMYYDLGRDPWHLHPTGLEPPALRHARVLYPVLAWLVSLGGDPDRLLWALPLINIFALAGIAYFGARLAQFYGASGWWGFALPLALNAYTPALRDLTDPLSTFATVALFAAWLMHYPAPCLWFWALTAVFSREQNIAVLAFLFFASLAGGRKNLSRTLGLAAVGILWTIWIAVLYAGYGEFPVGAGNIGVPFGGIAYRLTHLAGHAGPKSAILHGLFLAALAIQVGLAIFLATFRTDRVVRATMLLGVVLALLGGVAIYQTGWGYTRVFVWIPLGLWLVGLEARQPRWILGLAPSLLFPVLAVAQAWLE